MSNGFVVSSFVSIGLLLSSSGLYGQEAEWARAMFDKDQLWINYKSVAKGQDVNFKIRVNNVYPQDMQITGLATSCGCLSWDDNKLLSNGTVGLPGAIVIPAGQSKTVTLRLDTIRHHGEKKGTYGTVTLFDPTKNQFATVTIHAEGYIRTDVVLQPGSVNFGSVEPDKGAEQRLTVNYAGRNDWTLTSAKFNSPHLAAEIVERSRGNGLVNYDLVVTLKKTAPIGPIRDQLMLVTDDANNPQIPIQVEGRVEPEIVVTDANFGTLTPGKPKEAQVIVRYTTTPAKSFKIEKCERTEQDSSIKIKKIPDGMRPLHQISLTFTPPNKPGLFEETFFLTISGREEPLEFKAKGRILEVQ